MSLSSSSSDTSNSTDFCTKTSSDSSPDEEFDGCNNKFHTSKSSKKKSWMSPKTSKLKKKRVFKQFFDGIDCSFFYFFLFSKMFQKISK